MIAFLDASSLAIFGGIEQSDITGSLIRNVGSR